MIQDPSRRRFLLASSGLMGLSLAGCAAPVRPDLKLADTPFTQGVASGEPTADGMVLWTRLVLDPRAPSFGLDPDVTIPVDWVLYDTASAHRIVRSGTALAEPAWGWSVHVEVSGLQPDREYFYRFTAAGHISPLGRTRTTPAPGAEVSALRVAWASCQHWQHGEYAAYYAMAADAPDLILHLGDYIYENADKPGEVRSTGVAEPVTLDEYRRLHAVYRSDPALQAAHAVAPWLVTWDDHDVQNDYADLDNIDGWSHEKFALRRAAAYQAYWESLPLRRSQRPAGANLLLYRGVDWGSLVQFRLLDDRQYRSNQPCPGPKPGGQIVRNCAERQDPARTMFGAAQEQWLKHGLAQSKALWNVIGQGTLMTPFDEALGPDVGYWSDGWDGYPAARQRLLDYLHQAQIRNPVVWGGDVHAFFANDLKLDFANLDSPTVASEFVGTSISSLPFSPEYVEKLLPENPQIGYYEGRYRGYARATISRREMTVDFLGVNAIADPHSAVSRLQSFVVESDHAGVQRA